MRNVLHLSTYYPMAGWLHLQIKISRTKIGRLMSTKIRWNSRILPRESSDFNGMLFNWWGDGGSIDGGILRMASGVMITLCDT